MQVLGHLSAPTDPHLLEAIFLSFQSKGPGPAPALTDSPSPQHRGHAASCSGTTHTTEQADNSEGSPQAAVTSISTAR